MDIKIFKNSFITFFVSFIILCILFYIFKIGYSKKIYQGQMVEKFSWKYPLAISLIIWIIWHFWLFPPDDIKETIGGSSKDNNFIIGEKMLPTMLDINDQKINMENWR